MKKPLTRSTRPTTPPRSRWLRKLCVTAALAVLGVALYQPIMNPAMSSSAEGERLKRMQQSPQWHDGNFGNPQPQWVNWRSAWSHLLFGKPDDNASPNAPINVVATSIHMLNTPPASGLRVTWFGHSSTLLEIDGHSVLIDPIWSNRASPVSWIGPQRWYAPPIALEALRDKIDVVVISHDHFDHLDYTSVHTMRDWRTLFVVPLGVGAHLQRWGIAADRIRELDWWQSTQINSLELVATPARHSSGRLYLGARPLWAGFALMTEQHRVWYSGDTGFHHTLADIGKRLGPFDLTLIDAGQYDADWPDDHLGPELAVEAHRLVGGKAMMPIHWALLQEANHSWTEPIERVLVAAKCHRIQVVAPRPGDSVEPAQAATPQAWWPTLPWNTAQHTPIAGTEAGDGAQRVDLPPCPQAPTGAQEPATSATPLNTTAGPAPATAAAKADLVEPRHLAGLRTSLAPPLFLIAKSAYL